MWPGFLAMSPSLVEKVFNFGEVITITTQIHQAAAPSCGGVDGVLQRELVQV
jgi:hypothetical protein